VAEDDGADLRPVGRPQNHHEAVVVGLGAVVDQQELVVATEPRQDLVEPAADLQPGVIGFVVELLDLVDDGRVLANQQGRGARHVGS